MNRSTDDHIKGLLSDGPKSFTELAKIISTKHNPKGDCAHGTFVTHLKRLVKEGIVKKHREEGSVTYSLMPEFTSSAESAMDAITLQSLMKELENKMRKELPLEKAEPEEPPWYVQMWEFITRIPLPNIPKASFRLRLDKDTLRMTDLVQPTSEMAAELQELLQEKLNELKMRMPATIQSELEFLSGNPRDWSEIMDFSSKVARKHGFRFLVASWYDGKDYRERILSATKNLGKLQIKHDEDCSFLDEVNKRCFYSNYEYFWEDPTQWIYPFETISTIPYSSLLEDGFLLHFHKDLDLMRLEAALISRDPEEKLQKDIFKEDLDAGDRKVHSPYKILSADAYIHMKLPFLSETEKKSLIADLLQYMKSGEAELYSPDYRQHPEDYRLAIDLLAEKLSLDLNTDVKGSINSPVMNFEFHSDSRLIDFSDEPLVKNFLDFRNSPEKRKWLQKCLSQGLPIFMYIPFDKLGFEVRSVL